MENSDVKAPSFPRDKRAGRESSVGTRFDFNSRFERTLGTRLNAVHWEREDPVNEAYCSLLRERTLGMILTAVCREREDRWNEDCCSFLRERTLGTRLTVMYLISYPESAFLLVSTKFWPFPIYAQSQ